MSGSARHRVLLAAGIAIGLSMALTLAMAAGQKGEDRGVDALLPSAAQLTAENTGVDPTSTQLVRTLEDPAGEVRWKLVSYVSEDGPCRDWVAETLDGFDSAMIGGCGTDVAKPFRWAIDGVELGGQWYNVISGTGVTGAERVRVALEDGSELVATIDKGVWLVAVPGPDPFDPSNRFDVAAIEAVATGGAVVERATPPSVQKSYDLYEQATASDAGPTH